MDILGNALVIGGGGGIGGACCIGLARRGVSHIVIADQNLDAAARVEADSTAASSNPDFKAETVQLDVTDEGSVAQAIAAAKEKLGRLDYCVIAAGIGALGATEVSEMDGAEFSRFLDVNVTGTFFSLKHVSSTMKAQEPLPVSVASPARGTTRGVIVNIASALSHTVQPGLAHYTTSKHAVLGLMKTCALDNVKHGIRVNSVCPSWVDTPMVRAAVNGIPELGQLISTSVPMGRMALEEEVADVVTFLASPQSSFMTGVSIVVDGGTTLTSHH